LVPKGENLNLRFLIPMPERIGRSSVGIHRRNCVGSITVWENKGKANEGIA
jgi:hypothetical protein